MSIRPFYTASVLVFSSLFVTACSTSNQTIGQVTGAIAGGVVGNQFGGGRGKTIATVVGALAGGVVGGAIGRNLDANSQQSALQAEYNALETGAAGQPVNWQGNNGTYGQVVPQQTYQVGSQNCRRYTHTIYVDGNPEQANGTACRNGDGSWTPLS
ncbi:MAG: glycine zipper 2TM domain-containing protein [Pseudomonadota bacterium]